MSLSRKSINQLKKKLYAYNVTPRWRIAYDVEFNSDGDLIHSEILTFTKKGSIKLKAAMLNGELEDPSITTYSNVRISKAKV